MKKTKSIVTIYGDICFFCGNPKECEHHLLFGNARRLAEEDGLKVPSCNRCHNMGQVRERIHDNSMAEDLSKKLGQAVWEKEYYRQRSKEEYDPARKAFIQRYGRSYL